MKRTVIRILVLLAALGSADCSLRPESTFFSQFSLQELVEKSKSKTSLVCNGGGGGGGGGIGTGTWSSGGSKFHSHKGDSFSCWLKPDAANHVDEPALIASLTQEVRRAIGDSRGTIVETGNPSPTRFYFRYALANAEGRVEISATKMRDDYYSFTADLDERSKEPAQ